MLLTLLIVLGAAASAEVHDSMFIYCQPMDFAEELAVEAGVELLDEE